MEALPVEVSVEEPWKDRIKEPIIDSGVAADFQGGTKVNHREGPGKTCSRSSINPKVMLRGANGIPCPTLLHLFSHG